MPGNIFISYRRDDVPGDARGIRDALATRFGKASIFMDVDNLLAGQRFEEELAKALASCDVFLAIIGPRWMDLLKTKASSGDRDYVREEIAAALKRKIVVIPVRVGREGSMPALPRPDGLPEDIRDLVHYQKQDVAHERFGRDAAELISAITALRRTRGPQKPPMVHVPWGWIAATATCVLAIGWVGAHHMGLPVWWPLAGDAKPVLEPSKDDLAAAAKQAVLKERAAAAEQHRREEADAKRKAEDHAKAEAERQRLAALQAQQERQRREEEARKRDPIAALPLGSGKSARDQLTDGSPCPFCPEMVVVPAGSFSMGTTPDEIADLTKEFPDEASRWKTEGPQHRVSIQRPFAVGRLAVTFAEWDACVADGGCNGYKPNDEGWGRDKRPAINVSWDDAKSYAAWLSRKTGKTYRLLSEAEREYVARAGTTTAFWLGSSISTRQANYNGNYTYAGNPKGEYRQRTLPVDSFEANPWGLYQVHGNVYEWVEDCWHESYEGAPGDGSAWTTGCSLAHFNLRVVRGGSWINHPLSVRSASRDRRTSDNQLNRHYSKGGFRLARTLAP
jgi:formylglycine-generating enzyme required for sulfatase activity